MHEEMFLKERPGLSCGSCRACCKAGRIGLLPDEGDDVASYDHEMIDTKDREIGVRAFLKTKANGECIYLGANGCTIHERRPAVCRIFDCRTWYLGHSRTQRKAMIKNSPEARNIFRAARERLGTLGQG